MPKKILLLHSLMILALTTSAQSISGKIQDSLKQPVAFASVSLLNSTTNTIIKTDASGAEGNYSFPQLKAGTYRLSVTATGFAPMKSETITIDSGSRVQIPINLQLSPLAKELQTVTVRNNKKLIQVMADKTVMNIENSILATGNSAFDLLRKAPGVIIDAQENVKMKGQLVKIFIDDKPAYLSGEDLLNYLKNLQADDISRIELIGNPGSRFPAEGTGGIINIRLKKDKRFGTNGSVSLGAGYGKYPKLSGSGSINYRNKKINLFAGGGTGRFEGYNKLNLNSTIGKANNLVYQQRDNYWHPIGIYSNARFGVDYSLSKKSTLGFLARGNFSDEDARTSNNSLFTNSNGQPQSFISSIKDDVEHSNNIVLNLNYKKDIDSLGSSFNVDADYGHYRRRGSDINTNTFNNYGGTPRPDYIFRNNTPIDVNIFSIKADWVKQIDSTLKIEAGTKLSFVKNNNEIVADSISNGQWKKDNGRSNYFVYDEDIYAAYFSLSKELKKITLQAGLRAEYTSSNGHSVTLNRTDKRSYFNLFPSLFFNYKANAKNTFSASYTYRINRPGYQSLNPFLNFVDPYTYFEGNPFLRPSYGHSLEIKHGFRDFLYTSISYYYTKNSSSEVIIQDELTKVSLSRTENVGNSQSWSFDMNAGIPLFKWWNADLNGSTGYSIERSNYPGYTYHTKAWNASFSATNSFTLPKKIKAELSMYMNAPTRSGIARIAGSVNLSAGVQKPVLKEKGTVKVNFANFIGPTQYNARFRNENLDIKWVNKWEGKRLSLSFSYKFGNSNVKSSRQRRTASQEEGNRVNL